MMSEAIFTILQVKVALTKLVVLEHHQMLDNDAVEANAKFREKDLTVAAVKIGSHKSQL